MITLAVLGVVAVAQLSMLKTLAPVGDPDTFWHLRAGEYLRQRWTFSGPEPWSRFSEHPWVLHEWLPELVLDGTYRLGGLPAVSWLTLAMVLLLFAVLYWSCRTTAGIVPSAFAATIGWWGASGSLAARPQLVTFLLLAVTTTTWLRTAEDRRPRWWLVPLTWVWTCSHGMWFTGPLVGFTVVLGLLLDRRVTVSEARRLVLVPVLGVVVAAVTPVGPRLLLTPFTVRGYAQYVTEWGPPSLSHPQTAATLLLAAVVVVVWARSGQPVSWTRLGLLVVAVGWSLLYLRTVAVGAVMVAPLAACALQSVVPERVGWSHVIERTAVTTPAVVALVAAAVTVPGIAARPADVPTALDAQLAALPRGTTVYNVYHLGGWLHWRHRHLAPVIDGRTEVYTLDYVERFIRSTRALPGWDATVRDSGARVALLEQDSALADALRQHQGWRESGRAGKYVLLRAPADAGTPADGPPADGPPDAIG